MVVFLFQRDRTFYASDFIRATGDPQLPHTNVCVDGADVLNDTT